MNNKGITLVELIISFALLMVVVIGMMSIIMNVRTNYNDKEFVKEMTEFQSTITQTIEKDLIEKGVNKTTPLSDCTSFNAGEVSECKIIRFKDNTTAELRIGLSNTISDDDSNIFTITYSGIKYKIPNYDIIDFLDNRYMQVDNEQKVEIKISDNYLIINIPYFEIDKYNNNLGIKIVYPIFLQEN